MFLQYLSPNLLSGGGTTGAAPLAAKVARQAYSSQSFNALNSSEIFYIDAGAWAGGLDGKAKTSFALVSDKAILLCSWLNLAEGGQPPPQDYTFEFSLGGSSYTRSMKLSPKAENFLRQAQAKGRAYLLAVAFAQKPVTPADELLIVVGDLHLNLFVDQWIDRFRCKLPGSHELVSLDDELGGLLDLTSQCGGTSIQVGDLYDVWMCDVLLRMEFLHLVRGVKRTVDAYGIGTVRSDSRKMLELGKIVPTSLTGYEPDHHWIGDMHVLSDAEVEAQAVDFRSSAALIEAIRRAHSKLFRGHKAFNYVIDGNHDNGLENNWWSTSSPEYYRKHPVLGQNTKAAGQGLKILRQQIGTGERPIHIEHGHIYDTDNDDRDCYKDGKGFGIVHLGYADEVASRLAMRSGHQDWALDTADWYAALQHFEMRLYGLRRADELFKDKDIRLVIIGHTHEPSMIASPARCEMGPSYPGWEDYKNGDNWFKTDADLAREAAAAQ